MPFRDFGEPHFVVRTEKGAGRLWIVHQCLCTQYEGKVDAELARAIPEHGDAVIQREGVVLTFHDWRKIEAYESSCRRTLIDWTKKVGDKNPAVHILLTPGIVSMGVSVASLVLKNLHVFTRSLEFSATLKQRCSPHALPGEPQTKYRRP